MPRMNTLTAPILDARWPRAPHSLVDGIVASAASVLDTFEINTPLRLAHFMSHCSEESGAGTVLEENLHYSAERAHEVWPSRFPTVASASPYADSPRLLADRVYGGRMGNASGTDDGWNFRGRGLIQITGRNAYEGVGKAAGIDLLGNPNLACASGSALLVAAACWREIGANAYADKDDIVGETRLINGGLTNLEAREVWLRVWKKELGL
jgi:putative chitinase